MSKLIAPTRRGLIKSVAAALITSPAIIRRAEAMMRGGYTVPSVVPSGPPGTAGNPVGFAAAPGYPGSLSTSIPTITSGPSSSNPNIYSFLDFDNGGQGGGASLGLNTIQNVKFVGCRFQAQSAGNSGSGNIQLINTQNVTFSYCSIVPRVALVGTTPPNAAWPSATNGTGLVWDSAGISAYCIDYNDCFQYGIDVHGSTNGPLTVDHCDCWGFGNVAVSLDNTTAQMNFTNNWFHDACNPTDSLGIQPLQHTDGIGYLNAGAGSQNILINNNTVASIGTTQGIAMQNFTSPYVNITITNNYLCGFVNLLNACFGAPSGASGSTGITVTDNTIGSNLQFDNSATYGDQSATITTAHGNLWRRNKFLVVAGGVNWWSTKPFPGPIANGQFLYPDSSWNNTDYTG